MAALLKLRRTKLLLKDVVGAWRTRRALNCLCTEVQDFVNCEDQHMKEFLMNKFHCLFTTVLDKKLFVESRAAQLQAFISETERRLIFKPVP